jgi:hypothetical protein
MAPFVGTLYEGYLVLLQEVEGHLERRPPADEAWAGRFAYPVMAPIRAGGTYRLDIGRGETIEIVVTRLQVVPGQARGTATFRSKGAPLAAGGRAAFTMTIARGDWDRPLRGASRPGEDWEATLIRLYHLAVPDPPRRRPVITAVTGRGTARVTMGVQGQSGVTADPPVDVTTDPPQWAGDV